jgi:transcription-repair coupling factor (superfamily II helicase)
MEILSIVSSIVSLFISGFAIWLSITFYRMSSASADDIKQSSNSIDATVKRLESIFDKLYSDTFTMVKETVTDMRQHIWKAPPPSSEIEKADEDRVRQLKQQFTLEIDKVIRRQNVADTKVAKLQNELSKAFDHVVDKSISVAREAKETPKREQILNAIKALQTKNSPTTLPSIAAELGIDESRLVSIVFNLGYEKILSWPNLQRKSLSAEENIIINQNVS